MMKFIYTICSILFFNNAYATIQEQLAEIGIIHPSAAIQGEHVLLHHFTDGTSIESIRSSGGLRSTAYQVEQDPTLDIESIDYNTPGFQCMFFDFAINLRCDVQYQAPIVYIWVDPAAVSISARNVCIDQEVETECCHQTARESFCMRDACSYECDLMHIYQSKSMPLDQYIRQTREARGMTPARLGRFHEVTFATPIIPTQFLIFDLLSILRSTSIKQY